MNCDEYIPLLSGHLDGANSEIEEHRLQQHLLSCPHCRELLAQMKKTDALLAGSSSEPPAGLTERIMAQVRTEPKKKRPLKRVYTAVCAAGLATAALLAFVFSGNLPLPGASNEPAPGDPPAVTDTNNSFGAAPEALSADSYSPGETLAGAFGDLDTEASPGQAAISTEPVAYYAFPGSEEDPSEREISLQSDALGIGASAGNSKHIDSSFPLLPIDDSTVDSFLDSYGVDLPVGDMPFLIIWGAEPSDLPLLDVFDRSDLTKNPQVILYSVPYDTMEDLLAEYSGVYEFSVYYPTGPENPEYCTVFIVERTAANPALPGE